MATGVTRVADLVIPNNNPVTVGANVPVVPVNALNDDAGDVLTDDAGNALNED